MGKEIGKPSHLYRKNSGILKFNQGSHRPWIGAETLCIVHFEVMSSDKNMSRKAGNKARYKHRGGKSHFPATLQGLPATISPSPMISWASAESPLMSFGFSLPFKEWRRQLLKHKFIFHLIWNMPGFRLPWLCGRCSSQKKESWVPPCGWRLQRQQLRTGPGLPAVTL